MNQKGLLMITLIAMCCSCQRWRDSIHDTFYGTPVSDAGAPNVASLHSDTTVVVSSTTTTVTSSSTHTEKKDFLHNTAALNAAEQALRRLPAYAGKNIYLYNTIHFYDNGRIVAQLQHPQRPDYVDEYDFHDGAWEGPKPVQLSVHDDVKGSLVRLDSLHFENVAGVYRSYTTKAASIEGAAPVDYIYALIRDGGFSWYPIRINGSRERYAISYNPDGSVKSFFRE
jgi:hypothetical protein